ncbi:hypothetical protein TNCT_501071 [Trichonephila clavata]|uniref:Uncharacterized protein n=1 Tax=Trichonephila clavata TaxID=2740835 RepID=A0A8X6KH81_TRICU|nr:hypothetical protein TNCT_501071 [Trichonephila clavata]
MDTQTLLRLAHSDYKIKRTFGGVFASDILPERRGHYQSFIVNTDSSMNTGYIHTHISRKTVCLHEGSLKLEELVDREL